MEDQRRYVYSIVDKYGIEMPLHYSGRYRTYDEAKKLCDGLNETGEFKPYQIVDITQDNLEVDYKSIK